MAEKPRNDSSPVEPPDFGETVGAKEARKLRARRRKDRTFWIGVGVFGAVGWSIAAPTLIGIAVGIWLDRVRQDDVSWTLALMLAGLTIGCLAAWHWVSQERKAIDEEANQAP